MNTTLISDIGDLVKAINLGEPVPILPEFVDWQPSENPAPHCFGSLKGMDALCPDAVWADYSLIIQYKGRWHALYPQFIEDDEDDDQDEYRIDLAEYAPLPPALIEAGGWPVISKALQGDKPSWVMHKKGLGYLLLAAVIL